MRKLNTEPYQNVSDEPAKREDEPSVCGCFSKEITQPERVIYLDISNQAAQQPKFLHGETLTCLARTIVINNPYMKHPSKWGRALTPNSVTISAQLPEKLC